MPDENRFSGLGDVVEEPDADAAGGTETDAGAGGAETEPGAGTEASASDSMSDAESESSSGPAFEFEDTTAKSVYVRSETLSVMDDAEFEVESLLRRDHDVRDVTGREFHDALVRVAAEHPEEVAAVIVSTRDDEGAVEE